MLRQGGLVKKALHSVKGMKDLYDDALIKHEIILKTSQKILNKFGFSPIILNILEHEEVFKRTLGESSEIITKEMYNLKDLSDNNLVLRPEGTAGLMRMMLETNMKFNLPKKFYYDGPMFRYERPQKGRLRQFYQIGAENLGFKNYFADVEIILIAHEILKTLKPNLSFKIEINTLGNSDERKEYNKLLTSYFSAKENFDKLSELSRVRLERKNPLRILDSKEKSDIEISEKSPKIKTVLGEESLKNFKLIKNALSKLNIPFVENESLVRGLDYYCYTCFELKEDDPLSEEKSQSTLIGGGRYDFLANYLLGNEKEKIPIIRSTGFAAGIERIGNLLDDFDLDRFNKEKKRIKIGLVPILSNISTEEKEMGIKIKLLEIMKKFEGKEYVFELLVDEKKLEKKFEYLEKKKFDFAFIIGDSEFENNSLNVKDLNKRESKIYNLLEFNENSFSSIYKT